jgi:hypothetical protein
MESNRMRERKRDGDVYREIEERVKKRKRELENELSRERIREREGRERMSWILRGEREE